MVIREYMASFTPETLSTMPADVYEAFKKDFQNGIVTLGDVCDADCFYCSQKWNPPGILRSLGRLLSLDEVEHFIERHLDEPKMIGSAYHVNSGEFFLHPDAVTILRMMGGKYHSKLDKAIIFSNGLHLTEEMVRVVKELGLHVILSLQMLDSSRKGKVIGNTNSRNMKAFDALRLLNRLEVSHSVAIVPLMQNVINGDFKATIDFVAELGTGSVLIHRPGYTKYTPPQVVKELVIPSQFFFEVIKRHRQKYNTKFDFSHNTRIGNAKRIGRAIIELLRREKELVNLRKLFLYAESVEEVFPLVLKELPVGDYESQMVKSNVFGGNVQAAGLLLVEDYIAAIEQFLQRRPGYRPEAMILPRMTFDKNNEDLGMTPAKRLEERFGIKLYLAGKHDNLLFVEGEEDEVPVPGQGKALQER